MENDQKRILLVDDEPDFLNLMKMRLEHDGYKVTSGDQRIADTRCDKKGRGLL